MNLYLGVFDFERFLRPSNMALLPSFSSEQSNNIVQVMDELQWVFTKNDTDILITICPFNNCLKNYLSSIGFKFKTHHFLEYSCIDNSSYNNIMGIVYDEKKTLQGLMRYEKNCFLHPFAVLPEILELNKALNGTNRFPQFQVVKRVNSKEFSFNLRNELTPNQFLGHLINSSECFLSEGEKLLSRGKFLVKDLFGVSGKGNLLIDSTNILKTIHRHIKKQEDKGRQVNFIFEPFFEKQYDLCCQFYVHEDGKFEFISTNMLLNKTFSYMGSQEIDESTHQVLQEQGYFSIMSEVAEHLHHKGYFGDVCVDSMMLAGGKVFPLVEINCRKSMSLLNYSIGQKIKNINQSLSGRMISISIRLSNDKYFTDVFTILEEEGVLYFPGLKKGVIPLSANTLDVNNKIKKNPKGFYTGRLYLYVISCNVNNYLNKVKKVLEKKEIWVMN